MSNIIKFGSVQSLVSKSELLVMLGNLLKDDEQVHITMVGEDFSQFNLVVYRGDHLEGLDELREEINNPQINPKLHFYKGQPEPEPPMIA